jgi:hypothetical protein
VSDDWHKDTPEPRHWLFYVLIKVAVALFAFWVAARSFGYV